MRPVQGAAAAALLGLQLGACVGVSPPADGSRPPAGSAEVVVREDLSRRFVALIGPKRQHDPPYLGTPNTNFDCLRSFVDRRTGETAHQLYVAASYDGNHDWDAAHDAAGRSLQFLPISRFKIACRGSDDCSYAEEFAAKLPETELRDNPRGFVVAFTDKAGDVQTVAVTADQVTAQTEALAQYRRKLQRAPAAGPAAP
jgi:hypothetical protein